MKPTISDVHVDAALTRFAVGWTPPGFVADLVFPPVDVEHESDKYFIWDRGDFFRVEARIRAAGAAAHRSAQGLSTGSYKAEEIALADALPDRVRDNADSVLNVREAKTRYVMAQVALKKEKDFATDFFKTGVWGTDKTLSGTDQWSDPSSDPLGDIETGADTIRGKTGKRPTIGLLGPVTWTKLKFHPDLLNGIKHTGRGMARLADLADLTEIATWYVAGGIETTSKEGATDAFGNLFGKHCFLAYVEAAPSMEAASAGYTFRSRKPRVRRWRDEESESEVIEGSEIIDQAKVAADLGYFINTAVA